MMLNIESFAIPKLTQKADTELTLTKLDVFKMFNVNWTEQQLSLLII